MTLLLLASAGLLGSALLEKSRTDTPVSRIRIGVLGDLDNDYLDFGMFALENLDPSRRSVEIVRFESEDAARAELLRGKVNGYLVVPEDFVGGIRRGQIVPMRYVATSGSVSLGAALTDEVVSAVAELLSNTQDAIYGTQTLVEDKLPQMKSWKAGDALGELYIQEVLSRDDIFETEVINTPTGLDLAQSMLCGVLVLFLLLWGITASGVFARREQELGGMLYARGMGAGEQVAAELGAYLALLLVTLALVGVPALLVLRSADLEAMGLGLRASRCGSFPRRS